MPDGNTTVCQCACNACFLQNGGEGNGQAPAVESHQHLAQPAMSAAAGVPRSQSQVAVITSRDARDLGSAISPQRTRRPTNRVQIAHETRALVNGSPATPRAETVPMADVETLPLTSAGDEAGTPPGAITTSPAAATPFDNVLSVLDRIKQRPHTPWVPSSGGTDRGSDAGSMRKPYSPVHFQGNGLAHGPRSSSRAPRPSPYGAPARGYPRPSRLAQASAHPGLTGSLLGRQDSSNSGEQLFLGQPVEAPQPPQLPPQGSSIFAHASGTPMASSRFARCIHCENYRFLGLRDC